MEGISRACTNVAFWRNSRCSPPGGSLQTINVHLGSYNPTNFSIYIKRSKTLALCKILWILNFTFVIELVECTLFVGVYTFVIELVECTLFVAGSWSN